MNSKKNNDIESKKILKSSRRNIKSVCETLVNSDFDKQAYRTQKFGFSIKKRMNEVPLKQVYYKFESYLTKIEIPRKSKEMEP